MDKFTIMMDTSAVGELLHSMDHEHIVLGLQAAGEIRVSALSILEAAAAADPEKRATLLRLQKTMTQGTEPFDLPGAILRKCVEAYSKKSQSITITVDGEHRSAWTAIRNPDVVTNELAAMAYANNKVEEERFVVHHQQLRLVYDQLFAAGERKPASAREMLTAYADSDEFLFRMIDPVYRGVVGRSIERHEVRDLLNAFPPTMAFFLSLGVADYHRSIAPSHYGRNNAGIRDLMFGAYLPLLAKFVTADAKQFEALSIVGEIVAPSCEVQMFKDWLDQILV